MDQRLRIFEDSVDRWAGKVSRRPGRTQLTRAHWRDALALTDKLDLALIRIDLFVSATSLGPPHLSWFPELQSGLRTWREFRAAVNEEALRFLEGLGDDVHRAALRPIAPGSWRRLDGYDSLIALHRTHARAIYHRDEVDRSPRCGCFYCQSFFDRESILEWIDEGRTALCPECGTDAVVADIDAQAPLTRESLCALRDVFF